jgi:hypothetical protein
MTHDEIYKAGYDQGFAHGVSEGRSRTVLRYAELDRLEIARLSKQHDEEQAAILEARQVMEVIADRGLPVGRLGNVTEIIEVEAIER